MEAAIEQARSRFAEAITGVEGDPAVRRAFARVRREAFLGPPPWLRLTDDGYEQVESANLAAVYEDIVIALLPDKRLNNGQPRLHARCLTSAGVKPGERIVHIGCGTGYYTAILAELTGCGGSVTALDIEPELAAAAARNLSAWGHVSVACGNAVEHAVPPADLIYVSAGCTRPVERWVDALRPGGRLLFPLTPGWDTGGFLRVEKLYGGLAAKFICRCSFIPCIGASDDERANDLRKWFEGDAWRNVTSLHFGTNAVPSAVCFQGDGWGLSTG